MLTRDHGRGSQAMLRWLLYDGHGKVVWVMFPHPLPLSRSFGRGVWRSRRGEGSCANLGHPEDETGLVYMRARYYEPATGRFISEDPSRDGVNWYLYADGNPVNKIDSDGRAVQGALAAFLIILSFAFGMFVGTGAGYMYAVDLIQQDDPKYKASPNWFISLAISAASFAGMVVTQPKGPIWGRGIRFTGLIAKMGLAGFLSFVIGFEAGMIMAFDEYLRFQELRESY